MKEDIMSEELKPCPFCGGETVSRIMMSKGLVKTPEWVLDLELW